MTPNWMQPLAALLTGAALTLAGVRLCAWRRARPADGARADRAAAELADARFRHVLETSPSGQLISGDDGRIVFANATAAGYFGLAPTELPGHAIDTLLPGHRRVASTIGAASAVAACDVTGQRRDGSEIPLQMSLTQLPGGDAPQLLTTLVDLSERKLREEQLWRDRSFLREVIDSNPCLIFVKDGEGRFTLANQHLAELYGTTPRELIGKTDADFKRPPEEIEALLRADRAVIASRQEVVVGEEKLTDVHGRQYLFHTIKRPIADRDGKGTLVLGVGTDITARKQRELEIERQRNELAHLSRVTMLSELSGSLAHELNQPLAAILANAQAAQRFLAQEPPNLAEIGEILHDIVEDDRHAGGVIQGLRLLLKKGETRQEPLDLNEIVQAVLKLVRSDLLNAHVTAAATLAPDLPKIRGERVQLQQVLLNLVANASEAMSGEPAERRRLDISSCLDATGMVQVAVADRGHGIAEPDLERVFAPFFTTKSHGLGLGLAVCRRIIEAHGGSLWAAPADGDGGGACFRFTVPVCPGEAA